MFDRVNAGVALRQGGRPIVLDYVFNSRFDFRFSLEVDPAKAQAAVWERRGGRSW